MDSRMKVLVAYDGSECAVAARAHCSVEVTREPEAEAGGNGAAV